MVGRVMALGSGHKADGQRAASGRLEGGGYAQRARRRAAVAALSIRCHAPWESPCSPRSVGGAMSGLGMSCPSRRASSAFGSPNSLCEIGVPTASDSIT